MLFLLSFFCLVNLISALKALFLFLDYNVRMLPDFNPFLHIIYAYMVTFTLFVYLFNPNKNIYIYTAYIPHTANQPKNTEI